MGWPTSLRTVLGRPVYAWQDGTDQTTLWKVKSLFIRQHHCVMRGKGGQWQPDWLGWIQKVRDPVLCTKRWHRQLAVSTWLIRCCLSYVLNHHSVMLNFLANYFHTLELNIKAVFLIQWPILRIYYTTINAKISNLNYIPNYMIILYKK